MYTELAERAVRVKQGVKRPGFRCINMFFDSTDVMALNRERMGRKKSDTFVSAR